MTYIQNNHRCFSVRGVFSLCFPRGNYSTVLFFVNVQSEVRVVQTVDLMQRVATVGKQSFGATYCH